VAERSISVVVVRRAYSDSPESVIIRRSDESAEDAVVRHYPSASFDFDSGFDTSDGGSFLYDAMSAED